MKNQTVALFFTLLILSPGSVYAANLLKNNDVIWEAGNNVFFKHANQDETGFGENDHPVELSAADIDTVLATLKIGGKGNRVAEEKLKSVFSVQQATMLGRYLAKGLKNAKPNQDIIFAMEKSDSRLFGLASDRFFVAGRAFFKDNKLNVIVGDYDRPRDAGYEAAYDPTHVGIVRYNFDHGSRSKASKGFKNTIVKASAVEHKKLEKTQRDNWLVIDVEAALQADSHKKQMHKQEEIAKKREELREVLGTEETNRPRREPRSLEERFTTLKRLRDKGLITDEEYAQKRKQLLNDL